MSQPTPEPAPTTDPAPAPVPAPAEPPKPADDGLGEAGKKALTEERKARQAAEAELARYRKAEQEKADAEKSDLQKATEREAAAEKRATAAEAWALRLEVATAKGLPASYAKRLVGATREELEADADDLLKDYKPAAGGATPPAGSGTKPAPDPSQGAKPPTRERPKSLTEAIAAQRKAAAGGST